MKRTKIILIVCICLLAIGVGVISLDQLVWKQERIKNKVWQYESGFYIKDLISTADFTISGDTMVFNSDHYKCLIRHQYFNTLILRDVRTGKDAKYLISRGSSRW